MLKFPTNKIKVEVEALGGVVELSELTIDYRDKCNKDKSFDTPKNVLLNAGLTEDQVSKLGERVATELMNAVIDLTYPGVRAEMERMVADDTYKAPTDDEIEESKKNL
jgi:hypothetical protein